MGHGYSRY
jgi:hypothetical protein